MRRSSTKSKSEIAARVSAFVLPVFLGMTALTASSRQTSDQSPSIGKAPPEFAVASVKLDNSGSGRHSLSLDLPGGRVRAINVSLLGFMTAAYQLPASRVLGAPSWFDSEYFDVEATSEDNPTIDQNRIRLQSLLTGRFKLQMHHESRQLPVYALVLSKPGKLGPQLHLNDNKCAAPSPATTPGYPSSGKISPLNCGAILDQTTPGRVRYEGRSITVDQLLTVLGGPPSNPNLDRPVVDRTGLSGAIDFSLEFAPSGGDSEVSNTAALPSLPTALQDQLGLRLISQTWPLDVVVIDHVEQPSQN